MGGIAAANLLFGKTSPSGKLPVTFYRTTEELPDFTDYSMKNRTYRYMEQEALYPFGYGLSYGDFTYDGLGVDQVVPGTDGYVRISVSVRNNSAVECEEVTQVYIKITNSLFAVPNYTLTDFKRVHLQSGEKKQIEFLLPASVFMVINDEGERILDGDKAFIYVGGSQPDARSIKLPGKTPLNSVIEIGGLK